MNISFLSMFFMLALLQVAISCDIGSLTTSERNELCKDLCIGGLIYDGECIEPAEIYGNSVGFPEAEAICENKLVEIKSADMYRAVYEYLFNLWDRAPASIGTVKTALFMIGNTFDANVETNPSRMVSLSDGSQVLLTEWYSKFPKYSTAVLNMGLYVSCGELGYQHRRGLEFLEEWKRDVTLGVPLCARKL
ncbi:unnamed protein product [Clavelina lepadiformis]|uniref:Lysozyme n=1 Tax=Clavelina lepadiformis TaxID=159417 RepID=A0ABP0H0S2_CLALP